MLSLITKRYDSHNIASKDLDLKYSKHAKIADTAIKAYNWGVIIYSAEQTCANSEGVTNNKEGL